MDPLDIAWLVGAILILIGGGVYIGISGMRKWDIVIMVLCFAVCALAWPFVLALGLGLFVAAIPAAIGFGAVKIYKVAVKK